MFKDRKDAGEKLAKELKKYKNKKVLVLAIPRGGVEIGYEVAKYLNSDFDLLVSRKLPSPDNPEAGFGAISEDGSTFIFEDARHWLSKKQIEKIKKQQTKELKRRIKVLRKNKPLTKIEGRIVILIDDGLAMGSTMMVSIMLCKNQGAKKIIVAVPVSSKDVSRDLSKIVDDLVILDTPLFFQAVAQVYDYWHDVQDDEVLKIMKEWKKRKLK